MCVHETRGLSEGEFELTNAGKLTEQASEETIGFSQTFDGGVNRHEHTAGRF